MQRKSYSPLYFTNYPTLQSQTKVPSVSSVCIRAIANRLDSVAPRHLDDRRLSSWSGLRSLQSVGPSTGVLAPGPQSHQLSDAAPGAVVGEGGVVFLR